MTSHTRLHLLKVAHTVIWAFMVLAIFTIWFCAARENIAGACWSIAIVLVEVVILGVNHGRCPLSGIVERYTSDRSANFDIYLPEWLAGRTKLIFGPLFGGGVLFTGMRWAMTPT